MADITCNLGGLTLRNPFVLASGVLGTSENLLERAAHHGCGAVTAKSCGLNERAGHANPIVLDWGYGLINAVGLTNPGAYAMAEHLAKARKMVHEQGALLFASIFAKTMDEFCVTAEIIAAVGPDLLEVDISCPNADDLGLPFAAREDTAAQATELVKKAAGSIPVSVKLAPNVPDIGRLAKVVEKAGADCITATNTMPGMIIDARAGRPVLTNKVGGISGYALKPITLRCVADIARNVSIPIIGTGGVTTGIDAVEMIMAGATAVGVGSAVYYRGVDVFHSLPGELITFMDEEGYADLASMRGKAL
jgi:dihydroorotate dehydrogenase (NAD+) catalytic subunit